jgi:hypothetical protein
MYKKIARIANDNAIIFVMNLQNIAGVALQESDYCKKSWHENKPMDRCLGNQH